MLKLVNIEKEYGLEDNLFYALGGISMSFTKKEFVAILGQSGSGKTTLLNIIGGLDQYSSGDLIIDGVSTKKYRARDWDAYRNHKIGFVFQSYNLIPHLTVLANVELALTLSGVSSIERKTKATEVLNQVGLGDQLKKKPNQLSGGQMQRVAIARALVNDPTIILADEPTGALDSVTSLQIMELLKAVARDRLVIMVTHNSQLAAEYSTRIIELSDGLVIKDSAPEISQTTMIDFEDVKLKKTSMSFFTALSLSFKNLLTKKFRTIITAIAGSIGIIGVALVLALSNGFNIYLDKMERETFSSFPLMILPQHTDFTEFINGMIEEVPTGSVGTNQTSTHINNINNEYYQFIVDNVEPKADSISYTWGHNKHYASESSSAGMYNLEKDQYAGSKTSFTIKQSDLDNEKLKKDYKVLAGTLPSDEKNEAFLVVGQNRKVSNEVLKFMNLTSGVHEYQKVINKSFKILVNDNIYMETSITVGELPPFPGYRSLKSNEISKELYDKTDNIEVKIVGIIQSLSEFSGMGTGIYYTASAGQKLMTNNETSKIYLAQKTSAFPILEDIITYMDSNFPSRKQAYSGLEEVIKYGLMLSSQAVGLSSVPVAINIFPSNSQNKSELVKILKDYNIGKPVENQVIHTDISESAVGVMQNVISTVSVVLIAFAAISLIVSTVMIGIITYTSVLERTKEIGVLRSVGARKRDISRVFNAETIIVGFVAGTIGILMTYLLSPIISLIIANATDVSKIMNLSPIAALILIGISVLLTFIAGLIPSRIAANKNPVTALRTE